MVNYNNLKGFDLKLDANGAIGIFGAAKFESREQLLEKAKKMTDLLLEAFDFQVAHGRA